MAGRIQAYELFPGVQLTATESLWAEASHWACDALNRKATPASPAKKSLYDMWCGNPPPGGTPTFPQTWLPQGEEENQVLGESTGVFMPGPCA